MVLGADKSLALAARLPGVELLAIDKTGRAWRSAGFPAAA
jgi:thiamine biosynthesis lipoprotein